MPSKLYYSSFVCNASRHMQVPGTWVIIHFWKMLSAVPCPASCSKLIDGAQPLQLPRLGLPVPLSQLPKNTPPPHTAPGQPEQEAGWILGVMDVFFFSIYIKIIL